MKIMSLNAEAARLALPQLVSLLKNAVDNGASIGFLPPLREKDAEDYWLKRIAVLEADESILLLATSEDELVGTAQLGIETRPNGNHRAEVQKVIVHTNHRRKGIAKALMQAIEKAALERNLSLLFLDTRRGDSAELLYQAIGYEKVGIIPRYVRNERDEFEDTVVYYKWIGN